MGADVGDPMVAVPHLMVVVEGMARPLMLLEAGERFSYLPEPIQDILMRHQGIVVDTVREDPAVVLDTLIRSALV